MPETSVSERNFSGRESHMKKIFILAALLVALVSCAGRQEKLQQPVKVADYLFEVTVDDYLAEAPNGIAAAMGNKLQCSAVRNGNFYGRNLDYFISEISEIVVHTPAKDGRYATLGVGRMSTLTDAEIEAGLTKEQLGILPWELYDGINDAGLFCNMNVTPAADAGIPHTSPNPGLPDIHCIFLVRALLDNCATVGEAVEFVNSHNVIGMNMSGWDLHFMIGDPEETVVLEFIDNKAVFKEQTIMTNFFVNLLPEYTPHADGIERYEILKEHYDEGGESMEGMWNLMRRVRFSQSYDPATEPFWKSEYCGGPSFTIESSLEEVLGSEAVQKNISDFKNYKETGYYAPEMGLWYTEHCSVYDIENKALWVTVHEDYDHHYEFSMPLI